MNKLISIWAALILIPESLLLICCPFIGIPICIYDALHSVGSDGEKIRFKLLGWYASFFKIPLKKERAQNFL